MIARRHMHLFGTTSEQLAEVSVAMRHHASMNPEALFRDPITVEDVVNSRVISDPLHLMDCCVITDGGGAVVVASPEVARNCRQTPVWVLGVGEAIAHQGAGKRDLIYIAAHQSAPRAFEMAGVTHDNIDMAMVYDSFTITVVETLEDLGFCKKGERRRVRQWRAAQGWRRIAYQHRRRRPVVKSSWYARTLSPAGSHQTTSTRIRRHRTPGAQLSNRAGPRHGRRPRFPP